MKKRNDLVCGVGINDADYSVIKYEKVDGKIKVVWACPYYLKWKGMIVRCYSKKLQEKYPTYKGCSVFEDWLLFSNFKKWMKQQPWEDRHLDKDLLFEFNKLYSPSTCLFIPQYLNTFILTSGSYRGLYPLGVRYMKKRSGMINELSKPYESRVRNRTGKSVYLGVYATQEEAHQLYLEAKLKQCEDYLLEFKMRL